MNRPRAPFPIVTGALVVANLVAYGVELETGADSFCRARGLIPAAFIRTSDLGPAIESMFLHANLTHLLGNAAFLLIFGAVVEPVIGHVRFALLYFASGLVGALFHVAADPNSSVALVGCSGAVFGVIAVAAVVNPRLLGFAIGFAGLNILNVFTGGGGSVSAACHVGGFVAGTLGLAVARLLRSDLRRAVAVAV